MVIILVAINGYSIGGYWWVLMAIILVVIILVDISDYCIGGYQWLLSVIILMAIGGY